MAKQIRNKNLSCVRKKQNRLLELAKSNAKISIQQYRQKSYYKEEVRKNYLDELKNILGVNKDLVRIESYDISHISGVDNVASMVCFTNGIKDPSEYRKFKINTVKKADENVDVHWLRAYYIYGDDARGSSVFAKIVQAVEDGRKTFPFTSGENKFDFIHIDELARQIVAASVQDKYTGIINVCTGKPVALGEQVEAFIKDHNFDIKLEYGAFPDRPYDSPMVWGDARKIQDIMSWSN